MLLLLLLLCVCVCVFLVLGGGGGLFVSRCFIGVVNSSFRCYDIAQT